MSGIKRKCVSSSRIYCDHCDDYVSRSSFYAHKKLVQANDVHGSDSGGDSDSDHLDVLQLNAIDAGNGSTEGSERDHEDLNPGKYL